MPLAETAEGIMQLRFSADELQRVIRDNGLSLLTRLKASLGRTSSRYRRRLIITGLGPYLADARANAIGGDRVPRFRVALTALARIVHL
jgi:hypothetical protein